LKNTLNSSHINYALLSDNSYLSVFGHDGAIAIYTKQNGGKSFSRGFGKPYEKAGGCNNDAEANKYLAGSEEFNIKEIEVFLITFK
jgi:hypothetical protein